MLKKKKKEIVHVNFLYHKTSAPFSAVTLITPRPVFKDMR